MKTAEFIDQLDKSHIVNVSEFLGEYTLEVNSSYLKDILLKFKDASYRVLMDLTAVDYLVPLVRTKIIYWMHNPDNFERVRIIVFASRGESIPSVIDLFEGANWYERELYDMFGISFDGHAGLKRILMPDDWEGHPMLRDYALTEERVEFKHGVKPKLPSEIIPNDKNKLKIHYD